MLAEKFSVVDLNSEVCEILDFNLSERVRLAIKKKSEKFMVNFKPSFRVTYPISELRDSEILFSLKISSYEKLAMTSLFNLKTFHQTF